MENITQDDWDALVARLQANNDLPVLRWKLRDLKKESETQRMNENVFKCPELLQHYNGIETGLQILDDEIENLISQ